MRAYGSLGSRSPKSKNQNPERGALGPQELKEWRLGPRSLEGRDQNPRSPGSRIRAQEAHKRGTRVSGVR